MGREEEDSGVRNGAVMRDFMSGSVLEGFASKLKDCIQNRKLIREFTRNREYPKNHWNR